MEKVKVAYQYLKKNWFGLVADYATLFGFVYVVTWLIIAPLGMPAKLTSLEKVPSFMLTRIFFMVALSSLISANFIILLEVFFRRETWPSIQNAIRLQRRESYIPLEKFLSDARKVYLIGFNLAGVITRYQSFIEDKAKSGCEFKFILTDPTLITNIPVSLQTRQNYEHAVNLLGHLMSRSNNVEVGFLKFTPSYGLLIKDGDDSQGEVQVEMYSQVELFGNVPMEDKRPHFILTKNSDKYWYNYFHQEFLLAWEAAKDAREDAKGSHPKS